MSASSSKPSGHSFKKPDVNINIPTTTPILKTLEPKRSPTDKEGEPSIIEKIATVSSGIDVITERRANPIEVSPKPVISMRSSMYLMT